MTRRDPRQPSEFDRIMYGSTMPHKACPDRQTTHSPHPLHFGELGTQYCEGLADPMAQGPPARHPLSQLPPLRYVGPVGSLAAVMGSGLPRRSQS